MHSLEGPTADSYESISYLLYVYSSLCSPNIHTGNYVYTEDLLALDSCRSGKAPHSSLTDIVTPLQVEVWAAALAQHPDSRFRSYILSGIQHGFRIGFRYASHFCRPSSRNMASALEHPHIIGNYLATECALGRTVGPLPLAFVPNIQISRFGVIPKKQTGKWRLICDLSSPEGSSVNDGIPSEVCSLFYVKVDDAARAILALGTGALLAKVDIKSAYRIVPVHPEDRHLLGMQWQGQAFIECALPFGLRSVPKIFTAVADAAEWILTSFGIRNLCHYLDDYLLMGPPQSQICKYNLDLLLSTFFRLGIPIAEDKVEGPSTSLVFLGIEVDTVSGVLRLPAEKISELSLAIKSWLLRRTCTRQELQSLVGKLQHACKVRCSSSSRWLTDSTTTFASLKNSYQTWCGGTPSFRRGMALRTCPPFVNALPRSMSSQTLQAPLVVEQSGRMSGCSYNGRVIPALYRSRKRRC